jgi:hypothetical protein
MQNSVVVIVFLSAFYCLSSEFLVAAQSINNNAGESHSTNCRIESSTTTTVSAASLTPSSVLREPSGTTTLKLSSSTPAVPTKKVTTNKSNAASAASLQPLPEPLDTFRKIREKNKVFVDKTSFIKVLVDEEPSQFVYLTRPKRFGKSVFVQMIYEFLVGNKKLFENTVIYSRGNQLVEDGTWNPKFPVIFLDFQLIELDQNAENFHSQLREELNNVAVSYGLQKRNAISVVHLIRDLWGKYHLPVSIIIDNYDTPLLSPQDLSEIGLNEVTRVLRQFYMQIPACSKMLRLVLIVGVSRLNILGNGSSRYQDLTFHKKYKSALGFTREEIDKNMALQQHMIAFAEKEDYSDIWKDLEKWYGQYRFSITEETRVLNPTSTCQCLSDRKFDSYAVNSELLTAIRKKFIEAQVGVEHFKFFKMRRSELKVSYNRIEMNIPLHLYLLCNGYLTIQGYDKEKEEITLGFPNNEIEESIKNVLPRKDPELKRDRTYTPTLQGYLDQNNVGKFVDSVNDFIFRKLSHTLRKTPITDEYSATHHLFSVLRASGIECQEGNPMKRSDGSEAGDVDIHIISKMRFNHVFEMKFKLGAPLAVRQLIKYVIKNEVEFRKAIQLEKHVYLVGMNVDKVPGKDIHEIVDWICIPYEDGVIYANKMTASHKDKLFPVLKKGYDLDCKKDPELKSKKIVWD